MLSKQSRISSLIQRKRCSVGWGQLQVVLYEYVASFDLLQVLWTQAGQVLRAGCAMFLSWFPSFVMQRMNERLFFHTSRVAKLEIKITEFTSQSGSAVLCV